MKIDMEPPIDSIDGIWTEYATYVIRVMIVTVVALFIITILGGMKLPVDPEYHVYIYAIALGAVVFIIGGLYPFIKRIRQIPVEES